MCGIVGYVGEKPTVGLLLDNLKKLEYRGYDSAGIAVLRDGALRVVKTRGRLAALEQMIPGDLVAGESVGGGTCGIGIGHTRWATHGRPSDINAHPLLDCAAELAVVHNGIIENFAELKEELEEAGHRFRSETDTEVLPHLIEELYNGNGRARGYAGGSGSDLVEAVRRAVHRLEGSFAVAVVSARDPGAIVAARKESPLVIGVGRGENYLASDIPAILAHTRDVRILEDGEIAVITKDSVRVETFDGRPVDKPVTRITWDAAMAEKGGYEHFMLKEIHEQPRAIRDTLSGRVDKGRHRVDLGELGLPEGYLASVKKVQLVACGTASHACRVARLAIERLARLSAEVEIASEFRYSDPMVGPDTLTCAISQSGETADTLAAVREARARGSRVLAVTNVVGSSLAREADHVLYTWAGPEIAVASTKAFVTQLVAGYLIAIHLGAVRRTLGADDHAELAGELERLPQLASEALESGEPRAKEIAGVMAGARSAFFIGRGLDHVISLEGALKLKEISYVHAEACPAGELKHGTLALVVSGVPVVALATQPALFDKMVNNIREVKARDAFVIGVVTEGCEDVARHVDEVIAVPRTHPVLSPVLSAIPLQLIAYYAAVARGCDVDKPRNLAKSVTVE